MEGLDKLAAEFQVVTSGMGEDDIILLAAAVETVLLEKEAAKAELTAEDVLLISAAVVDSILGR